jgi:hypothetical protein
MPSTNSPIIISQAEFDTYSNDWVNVVTNNQADDLARCFRAKKDIHKQNINFVYFSALQIAQLVSTVGAQHVKVRFLIIREADNYPRFALALFASDDLNGRLSAYYVSQQYWTGNLTGGPEQVAGQDVFSSVLLPDALATYWRDNWSPKGADPLATQDMFNSPYGYLRGYTFEMDDFLKPLVQIKAGIKMENANPIRINFGLHNYYPTNSTNLDTTFGLMVSYYVPSKSRTTYAEHTANPSEGMHSQDIEDTEVFYDLGSPCPPKC